MHYEKDVGYCAQNVRKVSAITVSLQVSEVAYEGSQKENPEAVEHNHLPSDESRDLILFEPHKDQVARC